mgnify:CR=1 FL=1
MAKHSLHARHAAGAHIWGKRVALCASMSFLVGGGAIVPSAMADDVEDLIKQVDELSHEVTAKVEELKGVEDDIAIKSEELERLQSDAVGARAQVQAARSARDELQSEVNRLAASRYRNVQADLVLSTLDSGSPQTAIDRAAYLDSLSRKQRTVLSDHEVAAQDAATKASAANVALAEAEYLRNDLDSKRSRLERERESLQGKIEEIEARVDSLSPEARSLWEGRLHPVDAASLPPVGDGVVGAALAQVGKPYGWGATGPSAFDCSGLMVWAYGQNGKAIPRTSQAQLAGGTPVSMGDLQPGDIVGYYPGVTHVGMYIGDGMIVHASDYGIPVQVVPLDSMPVQGAVRY